MNDRAGAFLKHWQSEHVQAVTDERRLREAVRLAIMCREDATRAGVPAHELRAAAQGDLIRGLLTALDLAARPTVEPQPQSFLIRVLAQIRRKSAPRGEFVS